MIKYIKQTILLLSLFYLFFDYQLSAKFLIDTVIAENVTFSIVDNKIVIEYDIMSSGDQKSIVSVVLKRESDISFIYRPVSVTGAVGEGFFNGKKQRIIWEVGKDKPDWFKGEDYYFEVIAMSIKPSTGISPFVLIGGGALVLGGGAAFLLLQKKSVVEEIKMPEPPGRPK